MCLQNSVRERIILAKDEILDMYSNNNDYYYNDSCDYLSHDGSEELNISPTDLCIIELNIRGLVNKQKELDDLLHGITYLKRADIVILVETWLTKENEHRVKLPGYTYYGEPRTHKRGGGVGFLVNDRISFKKRLDLNVSSTVCENCFIEVKSRKFGILIGSIYRPPNTNSNEFLKVFKEIIKNVRVEKNKSVIMGMDHNLDLLKHHIHNNTQKFLECLTENSLIPSITRPTRITSSSATLIDNIAMTPDLYGKQNSCILIHDISDHLPCMSLIKDCLTGEYNIPQAYSRSLTEKKMTKIKDELLEVAWEEMLDNKSVNECMDFIHKTILTSMDRIAPEKLVTVSTNKVLYEAWMTPGLKRSSKKQLKLYSKSLRSNDQIDIDKYKLYRCTLKKIKRCCKNDYFVKKCTEFRNNSRKLWAMVNNIIGKTSDKRCVISKIKTENIETTNSQIIVNSLASHFASVGAYYAKNIENPNVSTSEYLNNIQKNQRSLFLSPTSEIEVMHIINNFITKNSSGWDGITNNLVKNIKAAIVKPMCILINKSFLESEFPESLKLANVAPLFKSGDTQLCTNYRPILLLPVLSKIIEKVMYRRVYEFLQETGQLYQSQYGFRRKHSCEHAIQELVGSVLKGRNNNEHTAAIFLDLSKAFDSLKHDLLLQKLEIYGVRGQALDWFRSYLTNRVLKVKCLAGNPLSQNVSDSYPIEYGVPQSSCLGPLLFLVYCNDLSTNLTYCRSILFADDTTLYRSHNNITYLKWCLQEDMSQLADWFRAKLFNIKLN